MVGSPIDGHFSMQYVIQHRTGYNAIQRIGYNVVVLIYHFANLWMFATKPKQVYSHIVNKAKKLSIGRGFGLVCLVKMEQCYNPNYNLDYNLANGLHLGQIGHCADYFCTSSTSYAHCNCIH